MTEFRSPLPEELPALRRLWREAFHESEEFIDLFFSTAYSPERCRVAVEDGVLAAMLYWFDCEYRGRSAAYLYGVATAKACRGRGLATALMEDTQEHLEDLGYAFALLVPAGESLFRFYGARGYETVGFLREETRSAGTPVPYRQVTAQEYAQLRRSLLPRNAVIQERENLALLAGYARFFAGDGWCAVCAPGERAVFPEFLGDWPAAPGLLAALGMESALVRSPGGDKPFAMARALVGPIPKRTYFAFAFD